MTICEGSYDDNLREIAMTTCDDDGNNDWDDKYEGDIDGNCDGDTITIFESNDDE